MNRRGGDLILTNEDWGWDQEVKKVSRAGWPMPCRTAPNQPDGEYQERFLASCKISQSFPFEIFCLREKLIMQIKIWIILNIKILNFKALCFFQIEVISKAKLELEIDDRFSTKCQKVLISNFSCKKLKVWFRIMKNSDWEFPSPKVGLHPDDRKILIRKSLDHWPRDM